MPLGTQNQPKSEIEQTKDADTALARGGLVSQGLLVLLVIAGIIAIATLLADSRLGAGP